MANGSDMGLAQRRTRSVWIEPVSQARGGSLPLGAALRVGVPRRAAQRGWI